MSDLISIREWPVERVLDLLLIDKTTKKNIIFATGGYYDNGKEIDPKTQITRGALLGFDPTVIQPRVLKSLDVYQGAWKKYGFIMSLKVRTPMESVFAYVRGWKIDDYRLGVSRANPAITGEEVEDIESYNSLEEAKESKYYMGLELSALLYKSIFFGAESPNLNRYLNNLSVK